jgi:hypothetical protein
MLDALARGTEITGPSSALLAQLPACGAQLPSVGAPLNRTYSMSQRRLLYCLDRC